MEPPPPPDFENLFRDEDALLCPGEPRTSRNETLKSLRTESPGPAGEPWISYTPLDRVGLAFSGGGIRSATFNLGVLKALHELDVLKHVHYLSTVSGGGYIGAWWSAWQARWGREFPAAHRASPFLSRRIGFFQGEMWNAIMPVLSAVLPAAVVASSIIALAFLEWLGLNSLILADALGMPLPAPSWLKAVTDASHMQVAPVVLSLIMIVTYICFEWTWHGAGKAEKPPSTWRMVVFHVVMSALIVVSICIGWRWLIHASWMRSQPWSQDVPLWEWSTGISPGRRFSFSPHLFDAPILLAGIALVVFVPRLLIGRLLAVSVSGKIVSIVDRALSRMLGAAVVFVTLGVFWLAGCWLNYKRWDVKVPAVGALLSGGAFTFLQNWIGRLGSGKKGGVMDIVKPLIPQILAYIAVALWAICIAALLAGWIEKGVSPWLLFVIALGIVVFAALFFDPTHVSMHSFYRDRLARAYLGASNPSNIGASGLVKENRQTDVHQDDDIELRRLSPSGRERPIHLVCCAINEPDGYEHGNSSRGARSAVLSKFGFAIGNYWKTWETNREGLTLGSAITASAAAFNSNILTFACSALNLRLGLWLGHPLSDKIGAPKWTPGLLFLKEMFGLTNSGLRRTNPITPVAKYVYLSDGGHFENLGLYELVRRHCRYIIVSDCRADPDAVFDDFGNAVRRIRKDFGVEIDVDLSPLKPNEAGLSKQHVAVGNITYDPRGDRKDTAVLLYFKPTLTGDEPCDITQYRTRNKEFPHESTGDQFHDEAQWESYRRLGEHAARSALRFVERVKRTDDLSVAAIFNGARWKCYQPPERLEERIVELTGRRTALAQQLREKAPQKLIREMYPELQTITRERKAVAPMTAEEMCATLHFLLQIIQLMEDVWLTCHLETHWNHPSNLGWMNTFQRWAYAPSFRLWWPILKPMYDSEFSRFMEEQLDLADEDYPPTTTIVRNCGHSAPDGVAQIYWKRMHAQDPPHGTDITVYSYDLNLTLQTHENADIHYSVQAGLAFVDLGDRPIARWSAEWFFVSPGLLVSGIDEKFLNQLLSRLKQEGVKRCEVHDMALEWLKRTDVASREKLSDLLAFYKRAHFSLHANGWLVRDLN
jgi:hypothetical protein